MACCEKVVIAATKRTPCECPAAGWCERHKLNKWVPRWHELCSTRIDYFELWERGEGPGQVAGTTYSRRPFGLGDLVAFLIRIVTFGKVEMCESCKGRKAWLNSKVQLWPIRWPSIKLPSLKVKRTLRGYDIDGVLVPRKVMPVGKYVVISGRKESKDRERTFSEIGTAMPIYLRPDSMGADGDAIAAGRWKAQKILELDVTDFYEDDETQAAIIRERCPDCRVRMVR